MRFSLIPAAALLLLALMAGCHAKPPEVYEIPDGYRGWVEVRAKRAECPPLPHRGDETIFVIPPGGVLCTSSPIAFGVGREKYYYVKGNTRVRLSDSPDDRRPMIWNVESYGSDGVGPQHEMQRDRIRFFVGTKAEYESRGR